MIGQCRVDEPRACLQSAVLMSAALLLTCVSLTASAQSRGTDSASELTGLWSYETLRPAKGAPVGLSGYFVFLDGYFVQEALNHGDPFDRQTVQAHAGTYSVGQDGEVRIVTDVQLAVRPGRVPPVLSNPGRTHEITPAFQGDGLTLTFGSGTVQTFRRAGPGKGRIVRLDTGALALVDDKFILVAESPGVQVVGAGRVEGTGDRLRFIAERWVTAVDGKVTYQRDVQIRAELNETMLRVSGIPPLRVRQGRS